MPIRKLAQEELIKPTEKPKQAVDRFGGAEDLAGEVKALKKAQPKSNIRKLPEEERIGEDGFRSRMVGQGVAGVQDVTGLIAEPLERTFGTVIHTPDGGWEAIGPEEATRRQEEGTLPGLSDLASKDEPATVLEAGVRAGGQMLVGGPIGGRVAAAVRPVKKIADTTLGRVKQFPQKMLNEAGNKFRENPKAFVAGETFLGYTAGGSGFLASQAFPDSDAAKLAGELVGGILPQFVLVQTAIRLSGGLRNLINKIRHPFTETGGVERAKARTSRAVPKDNRAEVLNEMDAPTTIDPETNLPVLTPAQRTGESGLLSLERSIVESSETLLRESDEQIARANAVISQSVRELTDAPTAAVSQNIEDSHKHMKDLLDTRVRIAAQKTTERISDLGPKVTLEDTNIIAREEIEGALKAARKQEKEFYDLIDPETPSPFVNTLSLVNKLKRETSKAQQEDIASVADIVLNLGKKPSTKITGDLVPTNEILTVAGPQLTTIKELRGVQSKLREVARNSRSGESKNLNRARIADQIADTITDDIAENLGGPETTDAVKTAVAFSRNLNERFSQGATGKILQKGVNGGPRVAPSLTLDETIGMTGPKARENLDSILRSFDSPEAPSSQLVIGSAQDYLRTKFLKVAVDRGQINKNAATRFVSQNAEILLRLPALRRQLDEVIESGDAMAITERNRNRVSLDDPKVSKATMYIESGPVETFKRTAKLKPKEAAKQMQLLINRVAKDSTGEAKQGLKSGFVEFLLAGARGESRDITGAQFLSGFAMRDALKDPSTKAMVEKLFSKPELERIAIITNDLVRLEKRRTAHTAPEGVLGDLPSSGMTVLAGLLGAGTGRRVAKTLGMGGTIQIPGIFAKSFRDMANSGVKDPASKLLRDAVNDEQLFKALLEKPDELTGEISEVGKRQLHLWASKSIAEFGGSFDESEDGLQ